MALVAPLPNYVCRYKDAPLAGATFLPPHYTGPYNRPRPHQEEAMSVRTVCSNYDSVKAWQEPLYKDLHQHPELSMQEERTLGIIKDKLSELGFQQN